MLKFTTLSALAEPSRLQIVELLKGGPLSVGEIADRLAIRQPQASKHLRVLSEAGFVEVEVNANKRIYKLRPDPFRTMDSWLDSYLQIWEERYDRLNAYLELMKAEEKKNNKEG